MIDHPEGSAVATIFASITRRQRLSPFKKFLLAFSAVDEKETFSSSSSLALAFGSQTSSTLRTCERGTVWFSVWHIRRLLVALLRFSFVCTIICVCIFLFVPLILMFKKGDYWKVGPSLHKLLYIVTQLAGLFVWRALCNN